MKDSSNGFEVTMHFWVVDAVTQQPLQDPVLKTYVVHPPAWCHDDRIELEMHLDHLAKLQYLYDIRREVKAGNALYQRFYEREGFLVRGFMTKYLYPLDKDNKRLATIFSPMNLRTA